MTSSSSAPSSFGICSAMSSNAGTRSLCMSPGHGKRDMDSLASMLSGCSFSKVQLRKILRKYNNYNVFPQVLRSSMIPGSKMKRVRSVESGICSQAMMCFGKSGPTTDTDCENEYIKAREMLNAYFDSSGSETGILQSIHETARMFQTAIEEQKSLTKGPLFAKAWIGVDHNAWIRSLSYQATVHALIKASMDITERREQKGLTKNSVVQQSLIRMCNPLEESMQHHLLTKDASAEAWLWHQQHPAAVRALTSGLERNEWFSHFAIMGSEGPSSVTDKDFQIMLFKIALVIYSSIMKLGPTKVSCSAFSLLLVEETASLLNALLEFLTMEQIYQFTSSIGLKNEFLKTFGQRAAFHKSSSCFDEKEKYFWIHLVQKSLRGAFTREGVRSKLPSSVCLEVLEKDLTVFGFFAALGRKARSLLTSKKIDLDDSLSTLFRYLEGGSVLVYPQLASLTTYQLFVEVAVEELVWVPFFEEIEKGSIGLLDNDEGEVIAAILNVCSCWVDDFMLYSTWIIQPESVLAKKFLSNVQSRLCDCIAATSCRYRPASTDKILVSRAIKQIEQTLNYLLYEDSTYKGIRERAEEFYQTSKGGIHTKKGDAIVNVLKDVDLKVLEKQLKAFDEDLKTVEEVLFKLEGVLKESKLLRFQNGRVHLTAINISLQKVQRLKREAQALEGTLKQKSSLFGGQILKESKLQECYDAPAPGYLAGDNRTYVDGMLLDQNTRFKMAFDTAQEFAQKFTKKISSENMTYSEALAMDVNDTFQAAAVAALDEATVLEEFAQFEALQYELFDLDFRIRECAGKATIENDGARALSRVDKTVMERGKVWDFLIKSTKKFKSASVDVLKGTQLLATDVAVAIEILKSSLSGHQLTEREKKILKRTCTDLASVIPIGILMLLPVTAVGHAAMLAAIQKYVPGLIPSAYAPERLDLLKQLEQLKKMEEFNPSLPSLPRELQ